MICPMYLSDNCGGESQPLQLISAYLVLHSAANHDSPTLSTRHTAPNKSAVRTIKRRTHHIFTRRQKCLSHSSRRSRRLIRSCKSIAIQNNTCSIISPKQQKHQPRRSNHLHNIPGPLLHSQCRPRPLHLRLHPGRISTILSPSGYPPPRSGFSQPLSQ